MLYITGVGLSFNYPGSLVQEVSADGNDSPTECISKNNNNIINIDNGNNDNQVIHSVNSGEIVTGVCIKTGNSAFGVLKHNGPVLDGVYGDNDCYTVSGVGTQTVTVTRTISNLCHDISHIDIQFSNSSPTPSPTVTPTPSATPTPTPSPSPTIEPCPPGECEPTPTPSPTVTPTPSATPTPTPENKSSDFFTTDPSCSSDQVTAMHELFFNGQPQNNIKVTFTYNNAVVVSYTGTDGQAHASFTYTSDGYVESRPDHGFASRSSYITKETNCTSTPKAIGGVSTGQVLGATTDPQQYADTGIAQDVLMTLVGISGATLTTVGTIINAKKNS